MEVQKRIYLSAQDRVAKNGERNVSLFKRQTLIGQKTKVKKKRGRYINIF